MSPAKGYRSPRNVARSVLERGAIVSPGMMHELHQDLDVATCRAALDALVRMGRATRTENGFYEATDAIRVPSHD